jgi:hypothetical protein
VTATRQLDPALDAPARRQVDRPVEPAVGPPAVGPVRRRPAALDLLRWLTGGLAVLAVGAYVLVAVARLRSGAELEWMEGGMVDEVARVLAGHSPYGPPSLSATPYLYTPLFTFVSAALAWVVGPGLEPLRAVSIASSLVAFWAVSRLVVEETRDRWAGLVAAGLLAASYVLCGAWFDVARVDSLMLALLLLGLLVARRADGRRAAAGAAVLMVLAVLAKQDALLPAVACVPWLVRRDRRIGAVYTATLVGGLAAAVAALQIWSQGWFLYYVLDVPAAHRLVPASYLGFLTHDLRALWWSAAMVLLAFVAARRIRGSTGVAWWFVGPVVAALVLTGWLGRVHSGGWDNVLIPAVAGVVILVGVALGVARRRTAPWVLAICALAVVGQFVALRWSPTDHLPDRRSERATAAAVDELRRLPGPVYLPGHPWLLTLAGRPSNAQSAALADVLRGPRGEARTRLRNELGAAIREQRFGSVVVDSVTGLSYLPKDFRHYYRFDHDLVPDGGRIRPVTGTRTGPSQVWVPRR